MANSTVETQTSKPKRRSRWRPLKLGCLGILLFVCGGVGALGVALQSGPVTLGMPGGALLKVGSDDTVLSNSTFQDGKSYYFDLNGNGVRDIIELNYLKDSNSLELVLHHATRQDHTEQHLLQLKLP